VIIVIPLAGRGSRFANVGFTTPKPLIEVAGKPMLFHAYQSVANIPRTKLVFVALKEHQEKYNLRQIIETNITVNFELVLLDDVTEGQLCTVLEAKKFFVEGEGLLIAASDTYIKSDIGNEIKESPQNCEGIISVAKLLGNRWSFAKTNEVGNVIEVAEKQRISDNASTGLYYFSDTKYFQQEAQNLIASKKTVKGEYYIMPLYNRYIQKNKHITLSMAQEIWDMGTPEAKLAFEEYLNQK